MNSAGNEHTAAKSESFFRNPVLSRFRSSKTTRHEKAQRRIRQQTTVENLFR
jgi:hypothetical protein